MIIIRSAKREDVSSLLELARKAGTGLTTLPAHEPTLASKVEQSIDSFASDGQDGVKRNYLLVMEDLKNGRIIGTSGVISGIGLDHPFYAYRMLHITQASSEPEKRVDTQLLQMTNDFTGVSEMATLFLDPDFRKGKLGKFLSKSRYLLLASYPERFSNRIIAEIRGWVDENEASPFWDAIGRHFFDMDFATADAINGRGNYQFINDLMPKFPIYTSLLPKAAQDVIGRPHNNARPAKRLLEKEGFRFSGAIDIFDGGPTIEAHMNDIWSVRHCRSGVLAGTIEGEGQSPSHIVCNINIKDFRIVMTRVVETDSGLWLSREAAQSLGVGVGDVLNMIPIETDSLDGSDKAETTREAENKELGQPVHEGE